MDGTLGGGGGGPSVGRVAFGPEGPPKTREEIDQWADEWTDEFKREVTDAVADAFERVLNAFCTELVQQANVVSHEMDTDDFQELVSSVRERVPEFVKKALTEDE